MAFRPRPSTVCGRARPVGDLATNLFAGAATPTVMVGQPFTVRGDVTSVDATPDTSLPDTVPSGDQWRWGESDGSGNPLGTGQQLVSTANCPGSRITGTCTVTATNATGFSQLGVKQLQLLVTDAQGRTATYMRTVNVVTNALYVSDDGSDSGTCGTAGSPCRTLAQGLANAKTQGKTVLRVAAGKQGGSFTRYTYAGTTLDTGNVAVPFTVMERTSARRRAPGWRRRRTRRSSRAPTDRTPPASWSTG